MATVVADLSTKSPENAKRQFVELYGAPLLLNRYLTIALVLTVLFAASLMVLNFRTQARYAHLKPRVIRIDDVGRAEAIDYDAATYRPQAPELRYFLTRFVVTHFSRLRATVQRDYPDSLFFLAPGLADTTIATNDHTREIELFLTNPSADDVDVSVKNVTLTELTAPPYRAAIDFEKSYYGQGTRQERKHETYVAQVQFAFRDTVPNAFVRVNPLGLQITNFRVDQAFDR
jgi:type IV secretory pathway TrbF-like protein